MKNFRQALWFLVCFALPMLTAATASAQPVLRAVDPPYGSPGTAVILSGSQLARGDPIVTICGIDTGTVQVLSNEQVRVFAPEHAMGIAKRCDVTLRNRAGQTMLGMAYTYYDPPPISIPRRNFLMGFVPLLFGPTNDPVRQYWYWNDARELTVDLGDIVSLLYSVWDNCDEGVPVLADLTSAPDQILWFRERGVKVFLGLEGTTEKRTKVGYCPDADFGDESVWSDYEAQVRYLFEAHAPGVGKNFYPDYLMLGIEMNMYYLTRPDDWENYKALLNHLYQVVREYTNQTKIVVSFQFDVMTSRWLWPLDFSYPRQWEIYGDLAVDVLGISFYQTFKHFFCGSDPSWLDLDHFHWFTDPAFNPQGLPIAITETGYSGVPRGPEFPMCGSDLHQTAYLVRLADILEHSAAEFMIWWSLHEGSDDSGGKFFPSMRLVTRDRECYPDCYPYEPGCVEECPLDPQGGLALETWRDLFALPPD